MGNPSATKKAIFVESGEDVKRGHVRGPDPQGPRRAQRTAVFAESGANFKKIEEICFQKIANRRDGSATTKAPILGLLATPTKRGHF